MALSRTELIWIEQRVANESKSVGAAYLLWFFLWFVSAHRFYLGKPVSAVLQIISFFFVFGFFWVLLDLFFIPGMARDHQDDVRRDLMRRARMWDYERPEPRYRPRERDYRRYEDRRYAGW